jgi:peptide chain release factor 2
MAEPGFWADADGARALISTFKSLKAVIQPIADLEAELQSDLELCLMADPGADAALLQDLAERQRSHEKALKGLEKQMLFRDKDDPRDAILTIQAGAGGVDAMDWAEKLERMYLRYFESEGFEAAITDRLEGSAAGIHYSEIEVRGPFAYGKLRSEYGVHRIQHVSRFDSNGKKQTSFAAVDVTPVYSEVVLEFAEKDLEIETMRSGGPGGQGVQTTDSAVRVRHLPSGLMVKCQSNRSQLQNKVAAMEILASKLRQAKEDRRVRRPKLDASFGHQTRTYVLEPYQMVKDHRSEYETGNVARVLDGDLGPLSEAFLRMRKTV